MSATGSGAIFGVVSGLLCTSSQRSHHTHPTTCEDDRLNTHATTQRTTPLPFWICLCCALVWPSACGDDDVPKTSETTSTTPETTAQTPPCEEVEGTPYTRSRSRNTGELTWWPEDAMRGCLTIRPAVYSSSSLPPSEAVRILDAALETWAEPLQECAPSVCLRVGDEVTVDVGLGYNPGEENANMVFIASLEPQWMRSSAVIATTVLSVLPSNSSVVDGDIFVNDVHYAFSDVDPPPDGSLDLQSVLLHELGHLLMIDHNDNQDSVMFPTETRGADYKRNLHPIDRDAICETFACYDLKP